MGALIAKFRKEKSSYEILEKLEVDIKSIEDYGLSTERQRRHIIANLIFISVGIYVAGAALIYQYFLPQSWKERSLYVAPLLLFPLVILAFKKLVAWYYDRKISKNSSKLMQLRTNRRKILEEVMEKKTYKEAQKILERFGDRPGAKIHPVSSPMMKPMSHAEALRSTPRAIAHNTPNQQTATPVTRYPLASTKAMSDRALPSSAQRLLPRPLLSGNRSALDKMVDYLVGDGPSNRYALICGQCRNHNGMALEEEFQYLAFRCAFCATFNPARKQRPTAPMLPSYSEDKKSTNSGSSEEDEAEAVFKNSQTDCVSDEDNHDLENKTSAEDEILEDTKNITAESSSKEEVEK